VVADDVVEQIVDEAESLFTAQRRVIARVWQDRSISKLNIHLLMLLQVHGPQSMSQLAALADVALPNLTGIVDRMEERELVRRERDREDRRVVVVHVTTQGTAILAELESVRREELRRILRTLDPDEQRLCLRAMRIISRAAAEPEATTAQ
jgi:DNA-binding MarR family transcriptional regulator